jgi:DNA-binding response OmpR family regulator
MRVLLVEDNDDDALLIRESLSETTLEIDRAERLSTALAQLTQESLTPSYWIFTSRRLGTGYDPSFAREAAAVPIVVLTA